MAEQFKFSMNFRPRLREQILGTGVVDTPALLAWLDDATVAYAEKAGIGPVPYSTNEIEALVKVEMTLLTPLLVEEEAKVYARVRRLGRSSAVWEYQINEAKTERPIATILMTRVHMDTQTGRSVPAPDEWKQKIIAFEGKENLEVA